MTGNSSKVLSGRWFTCAAIPLGTTVASVHRWAAFWLLTPDFHIPTGYQGRSPWLVIPASPSQSFALRSRCNRSSNPISLHINHLRKNRPDPDLPACYFAQGRVTVDGNRIAETRTRVIASATRLPKAHQPLAQIGFTFSFCPSRPGLPVRNAAPAHGSSTRRTTANKSLTCKSAPFFRIRQSTRAVPSGPQWR